jgi:hypothetical protein
LPAVVKENSATRRIAADRAQGVCGLGTL